MLFILRWGFLVMFTYVGFFFFKQKTAYEMRISDWSSDVCSSDLWGYNDFGEIGDGTMEPRSTPTAVTGVTDAVEVSAGTFHTCARLRFGRASCRERVCQYV